MQFTADNRLWSEWLSRYLDHCRRELSGGELMTLATALDGAIRTKDLPDRITLEAGRMADAALPLVDFIATAPTAEARMALAREAAVRLRAASRSR